jgi:hypothetical protein
MADSLEQMSRSDDRGERVQAALLAARSDPGDKDEIVLRLLRDPDSTAVSEIMVTALLEVRREGAIPLILRSLGEAEGASDETAQCALEGLLSSELDGVDVRGSIVSVVLETQDRLELIGALVAISWLAPGGGFQAPRAARVHVAGLAVHSDAAISEAARQALAALAAR